MCEYLDGMRTPGQSMRLEIVEDVIGSEMVTARDGDKPTSGGTVDGGKKNKEKNGRKSPSKTKYLVVCHLRFVPSRGRPDLDRICRRRVAF